MISRTVILAEARDWIGTPYQHQASAKGAGCDCLGLVRGVWRTLYGSEPQALPPYTPDWAERRGAETLLSAARMHMREICLNAAAPGDVLLFRMAEASPAKHVAILDADDRIIHAYWGNAVVRSRFARWWRSRCVAAFVFPGAAAWPS
ncbi:MAG: NlpC/P60 family protein [Terricaulis sp.]